MTSVDIFCHEKGNKVGRIKRFGDLLWSGFAVDVFSVADVDVGRPWSLVESAVADAFEPGGDLDVCGCFFTFFGDVSDLLGDLSVDVWWYLSFFFEFEFPSFFHEGAESSFFADVVSDVAVYGHGLFVSEVFSDKV